MEGISVGREGLDSWSLSLNFKVVGDDVCGWVYKNSRTFKYALDPDLSLLSTEVLVAPKVLIEW